MKQKKLLIFALLLLMFFVGMGVMAQSSSNYVLQRFTMSSGGHSSSTNFSVDAVIGQPATDVSVGTDYAVSAGFLKPAGLNNKVWLPLVLR
jgi:hypothetical protein